MSIRGKVNVVSSVPYPAQLRRSIADGKDETSAGILSSGNHAWIANGDKLSVLYTAEGRCPRLDHSFSEDPKDPVDITCVEELVVDYANRTPLLLVATSSLNRSQLCVYNPATFNVIRAIELNNLQVRCMAIVDDGSSSLNSLTDVLSQMNGVVALGCSDGSVVLVDLNRETVIKAYQGNMLYSSSESTPHPVRFLTDITNDNRSISEIEAAQSKGDSAAIPLIEGDDADQSDSGVTALAFSKETACLYIGYSSGLWQIWNLSIASLSMMYECAESTSPVANFCLIEPCEDPRPTVYLWVNHEGTDSTLPLFNMYTLSYKTKHYVNDYGAYYQDFISCVLSFSMYPGEEFSNVVSGHLVSAESCSRTIQRNLMHCMGLPPLEGIQLKLVITAFSLTFARGSTHTYLCVFDLDQWYKEQMPQELDGDASYIETIELSAEPLIASAVQVDTISLYHTEEPQEIHLVPQAFSFKVLGLSETGLISLEKIGLQKLWLTNTRLVGAKSLIQPTKLFHACVSAGLVPNFPAHQNSDSSAPSNEEMRSYILSVCLENGLEQVILDVGEQWETGVHAGSGCTLNFLFDWVWSSVSSVYQVFNQICNTLFSASGHEIDVGLNRRMQQTQLILSRLHSIQAAFRSKYSNPLYKATLEQHYTAIDIIVLFVQQVSWFMSVKLLPEPNSKGLPASSLPYEYFKLDQFAAERRSQLNADVAKFKKAGKLSDIPSAGLYLIDHFVHDYGQLGRQWEEEGGTAVYPPPSIQSLLRSLRLQSVPTSKKLSVVQYALLDILHFADKTMFEDVVPMIERYKWMPQVDEIQNKIVKGLWHLDHDFYEDGVRMLLERTIKVSDLTEGLHRAILRLLLVKGKAELALRYLRIRTPRLLSPDDIKLEMSLLLANKSTSDALHFQRTHASLRGSLLRQLIAGCLENEQIVKLINFPLDDVELKFFDEYMKRHSSQRTDDLRVLLLLTRSKYNEAKELHEQLVALHGTRDPVKTATRGLVVNGFVRSLCPISRDMYRISREPNLKNLPEYRSSKPKPLSVFVKTTVDENGFPNFKQTNEQLYASAIASSANLARFNGHNTGPGSFADIFEEEPKVCEESTSVWDAKPVPGSKRGGDWAPSSNKRQRMDEDAGDDIDVLVSTPLVKRSSRQLPDTPPQSDVPKSQTHSILKSGKTPGTPARGAMDVDDTETPKKTLRWDIPSENIGKKPHIKKSLLSTPTKEVISSASTATIVNSSQDSESIKSRLRSHSGTPTSVNKKGVTDWNEIADDAKTKVLFSLNLPPKKEKLPPQPQGPSFVQRLNEIIAEEKARKETVVENVVHKKLVSLRNASSPRTWNKDKKPQEMDEPVEDVEMKEVATPTPSKKIKFCDVTLYDDEVNVLDISGSPFTTRTVPQELREQLRAQFQQSPARGDQETQVGTNEPRKLEKEEPAVESQDEGARIESTQGTKVVSPAHSGLNAPTEENVDRPVSPPLSGGVSAPDVNAAEDLTNVQPPIATKVVSLSRSHYDEDEDEVGSEDPEEAEIPPVIEFSQPEEGLLIETSYPLKEPTDPLQADDMIEDAVDEEVQALASAVQDAAQNDSDSSVICLDSDSEGAPAKEKTRADVDGYNEDTYSFDSEDAPNSSRGRRSFFHDKYNTHQEESEESPSPEYSSGEDEWKNSDVDLYNMDEIPENTMAREEVELEDEIFGLGRGLQKSEDLAGSESEEDDGEVENEATSDDEDDSDVQEILSSEDEYAMSAMYVLPKAMLREMQQSQSTDGGFGNLEDTDESEEGRVGSQEGAAGSQQAEDEAQHAVNSLLQLGESEELIEESAEIIPVTNEDVPVLHETINVEPDVNDSQVMSTADESKATKPSEWDLAKAEDVIDFNLSQGQMFFGSPDVAQSSDTPPDRALFQWKTFSKDTAVVGGKAHDEETSTFNAVGDCQAVEENKMKLDCPVNIECQQEAATEPLLSPTEETLNLTVSESDMRHATSPLDGEQTMRKTTAVDFNNTAMRTELTVDESNGRDESPGHKVVLASLGEGNIDEPVGEAIVSSVAQSLVHVVESLPQESVAQGQVVGNKHSNLAREKPLEVNSFSCQTTLVGPEDAAKKEPISMSFGCQAEMDKTKVVDRTPPPSELVDCQTEPRLTTVSEEFGKKPQLLEKTSSAEDVETAAEKNVTVSSIPVILLEPPTPFKNEKNKLGPSSIDEDEDGSVNPCDVAFVGDYSSTSVPTTPRTPTRTSMRKSMRLARMSTPGRALAPDNEVNVSDSVLDIAVLDPENISDDKPVMVNKSMVTDKQGLTKEREEDKKKSRKSTNKLLEEAPQENVEGRRRKTSKRASSVEPVTKSVPSSPGKSKKSSKLLQDEEPEGVNAISKTSRTSSSESEGGEKSSRRRSRASSVDPDEMRKSLENRGNRASSAQLEDNSGDSNEPKVVGAVKRRQSSGSDRGKRHSSAEPETSTRQEGVNKRRASSEGPTKAVTPTRKRSVSAEDGISSPLKMRKTAAEPIEVPSDGEYKKRKIRHSITEPLGRKKHQSEGVREEQESQVQLLSTQELNQPSTSAGPSQRKKARSLHEYPVRRSGRPSALDSIKELPEDSPGAMKGTVGQSSKRSVDDHALSSMAQTKPLDISKWVALSSSQTSRTWRLSGKGVAAHPRPTDKSTSVKLDLVNLEVTPVALRGGSPTESLASSTSSKVLRSGRIIEEHTPTKRTKRAPSSRNRAAKALKLSSPSPAKVPKANRRDDDRLSANTDDDDDDVESVATGVSTEHSPSPAPPADHDRNHEASMDEMLSSRRLTRHQRSLLESSMSRGFPGSSDETPTSSQKRRTKK